MDVLRILRATLLCSLTFYLLRWLAAAGTNSAMVGTDWRWLPKTVYKVLSFPLIIVPSLNQYPWSPLLNAVILGLSVVLIIHQIKKRRDAF